MEPAKEIVQKLCEDEVGVKLWSGFLLGLVGCSGAHMGSPGINLHYSLRVAMQ